MGSERNDFIRDIIDDDLRTGRHQSVATRFPPEPNGYLHIGHAKSICLNFGLARDYKGSCNLRYDDTNPTKEDVEYVESIERDVRWLGFEPSAVLFSADYFGRMYELAERLVREGVAYVCDLNDEQIREYRGSLSEPGKPSPWRDRSVDENLALLRKMKAGELADGACTLRAKIDMASSNMKMRDPLLYRIRHAHHHRSGDAWCIYPMYDYAHPLEDAIEGITHSICTLEFENNRELYDWVLDHTGPWTPRPHQYEFARLALDFTVMSKRKLLSLVKDGHVAGWDDPRMPTIAGMRRRGYAPEAIRAFCDMIGVSKANSMVDIGKLEYCVRDELNKNAPRAMGVIDPLEMRIDDGRRVYIERADWSDAPPDGYKRLARGRVVRLRNAGFVRGERLDGGVVIATAVKDEPADAKKLGVIHWVDAATSIAAEVRLYDRLFGTAKPEEGGVDFLGALSKTSLKVTKAARLEASFEKAEIGSRWQLERVGYFRVDEDSVPGAVVLNRIITLRDEREAPAAVEAKSDAKPKNAKAATRPKLKSGPEYRAEARNRDASLAAAYAKALGDGVPEDQADLLSGDLDSASLFDDLRASAGSDTPASFVAKILINDMPPDARATLRVHAGSLGDAIRELHRGAISPALAKTVIASAIRGGEPGEAMRAGMSAPKADLGASVDAVIAANPEKAAQYRAGKTGLLGFFVGQVMRATPNLDANAVNAAVVERLK